MNLAHERRQLMIMIASTGVGVAIALSGLVIAGPLGSSIGWPVLFAGIVLGVGAQIVFIFGVLRRAGRA